MSPRCLGWLGLGAITLVATLSLGLIGKDFSLDLRAPTDAPIGPSRAFLSFEKGRYIDSQGSERGPVDPSNRLGIGVARKRQERGQEG
jgi:hypothetical protein